MRALLAAVCFVAVGSGCRGNGGAKINHVKLEEAIRTGVKEDGGNLKSVTCPPDRPAKNGESFDCTGVDDNDQHLAFPVTQRGGVAFWRPDGRVVDLAKAGHFVEKKVSPTAVVKCPEKAYILRPGQSFVCDVEGDPKTNRVLIVYEDRELSPNLRVFLYEPET